MIPRLLLFLLLTPAGSLPCLAADWPTVAHDNQRTGVTTESLRPPLHLRWIYESPSPPAAGWSLPVNGYGARKNKSNVSFDDAFQAISVNGIVYFCSSAENRLYAVDGNTGRVRWTFFTDAAPRLAPTAWRDRLLFGADDGTVYCLRADDGETVWKLRAAPTDERVLGYGRFSSLWPVRAGVMVVGNIAYFTAGLFPGEGAYLYAVRADDGELLWRRPLTTTRGRRPSPQGYMLAMEDSVFVTSRAAPTRWAKADGRSLPFSTPEPDVEKAHEYRFVNGGDGARIWDGRHLVYGRAGMLAYDPDGEWTNRYGKPQRGTLVFNWFGARQVLLHAGVAYFCTDDHVLAIDQERLPEISRTECRELEEAYKRLRIAARLDAMEQYESIVATSGTDDPRAKRLRDGALRWSQENWERWPQVSADLFARIRKKCRWMIPLRATESLILAGEALYAGGDSAVHALDRTSGTALWKEETGSRVRGLAVASGRLIVSTVDGRVRCYDRARHSNDVVRIRPSPPGTPPTAPGQQHAHELVTRILSTDALPRGYALVLGGIDGSLARELTERTGMRVEMQVTDPALLPAIRLELAATGDYGEKINVTTAGTQTLPYPPYVFNLVIDQRERDAHPVETRTSELLRVARPLGGVVYVRAQIDTTTRLQLDALPDTTTHISGDGQWVIVRRGRLSGSADWTHNYASPANTSCNDDQLVKGPFGILWYGEPGPRRRIDRHANAPMPLVSGGILFTVGYDRIMAYDVYNGVQHWERSIPDVARTGLPFATSNTVADETGLFVVVADAECWHLDASTGDTRRKFSPPPREDGSTSYWAWIARAKGLLFGSRALEDRRRRRADPRYSDALFAIDPGGGDLRWSHPVGQVEHNGIAIGDDSVFYIDRVLTSTEQALARETLPRDPSVPDRPRRDRRGEIVEPDLRKLVALDATTGATRWQLPFDATDITIDDNALRSESGGVASMYKDGIVIVHGIGSIGHPHREFLAGEFARRAIYAFTSARGSYLWGGRKGYRKRPIIVGDHVYAEPFAWHLKTGDPRTVKNPLSGTPQRFDFHRGYIGCSHLLASGSTLFGNKSGIGYCNLDSPEGFSSFSGMALACGLGAMPAGGVFVAPEGRAGCTCASAEIHTSIALYPRTFARDWALGLTGGIAPVDSLPVKHAFVNLGAPGYREDGQRRLWIPYPAARDEGITGRWLPRYQHDRSMFYYEPPEFCSIASTKLQWLFTSGYRGEKDLRFRLQADGSPETIHKVTLFFAEPEDLPVGARVFTIALQGEAVLPDFDIVREAGRPRTAVTREFRGVRVTDTLTIGLRRTTSSPGHPPVLSAIAIERE